MAKSPFFKDRSKPSEKSLLDKHFEGWPRMVTIVFAPKLGKYGCCHFEDFDGLACFKSNAKAAEFGQGMSDFLKERVTLRSVTFDEARKIAKSRPEPVTSLMLMDDPDRPLIHFVK